MLRGFLSEETSQQISFDDYLRQSLTPGETLFPYEILAKMVHSQEGRKDAGLSATMLTGCLRQAFWQVTEDYYQKPSLLWPSVRGTLMHSLLEEYPQPGCIHETRFGRVLDGQLITGQADKIDPAEGILTDWKTKREIPDYPSENYVTQLNIYRWILQDAVVITPGPHCSLGEGEKVSYKIERLGLIYLTMDSIKKISVPVTSLVLLERMLLEKIHQYQVAMSGGRVPDRIVSDPTENKLCTGWCPMFRKCLKEGA